MSDSITFDTYWKKIGSLQPEIFLLPYDQREPFRLIAQAAWQWREDEIKEREDEFEELKNDREAAQDNLKNAASDIVNKLDELQTEVDEFKDEFQTKIEALVASIDCELTHFRKQLDQL